MEKDNRGARSYDKPIRQTLRLTFRVAEGEVELRSAERLNMTCPPSIGARPEAGRNGGFWMELHDAEGQVLFHRLLHSPLGDSIEVHSPDGKIRREFGAVRENVFEVLLPDDARARSVALFGESLEPAVAREKGIEASRELARFDVSSRDQGGRR